MSICEFVRVILHTCRDILTLTTRADYSVRPFGTVDCAKNNASRKLPYLNNLRYAFCVKRRGRDSNPRYGNPYTRFPSVLLKPLGHLSNKVLT